MEHAPFRNTGSALWERCLYLQELSFNLLKKLSHALTSGFDFLGVRVGALNAGTSSSARLNVFLKDKIIAPIVNKVYDKIVILIKKKVPVLGGKLTTSGQN